MASNRLEILRSMLDQNPADPFARYGLAMEYVKGGELERAMEEFRSLLAQNPSYAAGYFHGGQTLEKMGLFDDARKMYERGIEITAQSGDAHTRSELQAALDLLPL